MDFPRIYKCKDVDLNEILNQKVGIIGFGNQGRAQALNLKDSGLLCEIGLQVQSKSIEIVQKDKMEYASISDVVRNTDILALLVPDQVAGVVYHKYIEPHLKSGQTLLFSHGYNIHYRIISPPSKVNVVLVAPSGSGTELRKCYLDNSGIPGLYSVYQDYSGKSEKLALAYCKAIGLTKSGVVKSTFKEETETDLFGEQVVLTGGIPKLIQLSYKVLHEAGYSPAVAWLVCYYELKTIVDMFHSKGFDFMNKAISDTAEFGGITRGKRIINKNVENEIKKVLEEIQSGSFFSEWQSEHNDDYPNLTQLREEEKAISIKEVSKYMLKELFSDK